jgi:hypothetical protein
MLHDAVTLSVAALCLWAIVSARVPTGIVITVGLCVILVATLWSLDDWASPQTVLDTVLGGLGLVGAGLVWRCYRRPRCRMRRSGDWGDRPPEGRAAR